MQRFGNYSDGVVFFATLGTQDTGRRQTKQKPQHRKLKR